MIINLKGISKQQLSFLCRLHTNVSHPKLTLLYKVNTSETEILGTQLKFLNYHLQVSQIKSLMKRNVLLIQIVSLVKDKNLDYHLSLRLVIHPEIREILFKDFETNLYLLSPDKSNADIATKIMRSLGELKEYEVDDSLDKYNIDGCIFLSRRTPESVVKQSGHFKKLLSMNYL